MTKKEWEIVQNELKQERAKALQKAKEDIIRAQLEYERIIQYYNTLLSM